MGFLEWLGFKARDDEPGPSDPSSALKIPSRAEALNAIGIGEAFTLSSVYRAVQILTTATRQLSLSVYRDEQQLDRQPALIRQPDPEQTRSAFLEMTVASLAADGNAYWRVYRKPDTDTVQVLRVLNPLDVIVETSASGTVTGYKYLNGQILKPADVRHLKLLRVPGRTTGLGPIQAAQEELRGAVDLRDFAANWFRDAGVPTGILKSDQVLNPDQAEQAKTTFIESQGGKRGPAIFGQGLDYKPVYLNPADAQFLENRKFTTVEIARLFGVPSSLMLASVEGNSQTYANVAQDWLAFVRYTLMAYLIEIEDSLSQLLPRGQEAKFNVEALLRSDTATRYEAHKIAIDAGFLTVNEVRAIENLPQLPNPEEAPSA